MNTTKLYFFNLTTKLLPPTRFNQLKIRLLRWSGAKVGKNVEIFSPRILGNFNLEIGDNVFIGHESLIFGASGSTISLDDYAGVGSRVILVTGSHKFTPEGPRIEGEGTFANIKICKGACVSTGSIILPGKTVGEMAHVAAGSVVTHDVPAYHRVAGTPAKIIKNFKEEMR